MVNEFLFIHDTRVLRAVIGVMRQTRQGIFRSLNGLLERHRRRNVSLPIPSFNAVSITTAASELP